MKCTSNSIVLEWNVPVAAANCIYSLETCKGPQNTLSSPKRKKKRNKQITSSQKASEKSCQYFIASNLGWCLGGGVGGWGEGEDIKQALINERWNTVQSSRRTWSYNNVVSSIHRNHFVGLKSSIMQNIISTWIANTSNSPLPTT